MYDDDDGDDDRGRDNGGSGVGNNGDDTKKRVKVTPLKWN